MKWPANSKALKAYGIDAAFVASLPESARKQSNLEEGHFWEGGMFAVIPRLLPAIATPEIVFQSLTETRIASNFFLCDTQQEGDDAAGNALLRSDGSGARLRHAPWAAPESRQRVPKSISEDTLAHRRDHATGSQLKPCLS